MKIERPICLEIEDAKAAIIASINKEATSRKLPMFLLEPILNEILNQVRNEKRKELDTAQKTYLNALNDQDVPKEEETKRD